MQKSDSKSGLISMELDLKEVKDVMMRPEIFTIAPGKVTVNWYDFCMLSFEAWNQYDLLRYGIDHMPSRKRSKISSEVMSEIEDYEIIYDILRNDDARLAFYKDRSPWHSYFAVMTVCQCIIDIAKGLKIDLHLEYEDDNREGIFCNWFKIHGKGIEG